MSADIFQLVYVPLLVARRKKMRLIVERANRACRLINVAALKDIRAYRIFVEYVIENGVAQLALPGEKRAGLNTRL